VIPGVRFGLAFCEVSGSPSATNSASRSRNHLSLSDPSDLVLQDDLDMRDNEFVSLSLMTIGPQDWP
jgi:hypothetical protein